MSEILQSIESSPILGFTLLLLVSLILPPVFERLHLPGLVGLIVAGVVLGPAGLDVLDPEGDTMKLLSDVGKIYLMFVAGLEIDLEDFRRQRTQALGFGIATFLFPLLAGMGVGWIFGMGWTSSILLGSLLASHTLLGYPIARRLGVAGNAAVTATIGATIFTDIAALLVLAICVAIASGNFTPTTLVIQLGALAIYSFVVLVGLDWVGRRYFAVTGDEESNQFLFVLLAVFIAAAGAQLINVDKIVGAFLAGLAINDVVGRSPVEEKVVFVGSTLFIPFFFVGMGLLIDVDKFISAFANEFWLISGILVALFAGKFLAALTAQKLFRYSWPETMTMWSLSLPQVAATLAAALAGFNAGILPEAVFNAVIVLMLVTAIAGPVLTSRFASRLNPDISEDTSASSFLDFPASDTASQRQQPFTVVVPVSNPSNERNLVELAALLARHESGELLAMTIAKGHVRMDDPRLESTINANRSLLDNAVQVAQEFGVEARSLLRISDDIGRGIARSAKEANADLIVMGWGANTSLKARLVGSVVDSVFWAAHCPVTVVRLTDEPVDIHQILVPIRDLSRRSLHAVRFAVLFADTHEASVTVLHVFEPGVSEEKMGLFMTHLSEKIADETLSVDVDIQTRTSDKVARTLLEEASGFDMVVLRSLRRVTMGGLAVSDLSGEMMSRLKQSVVLLGEHQAN